jgi:YHS domain-containing protein
MTHVPGIGLATWPFDPVCGKTLDLSEALGPVVTGGKRVFFCSSGCQSRYLHQVAHERPASASIRFRPARVTFA